MQEERLVGVDLLGVGDELGRLVGEVWREVVALLGCRRRVDLMVVVHEIGIPLAAVATEEPVVALEAATQGPAVVRPGRGFLAGRDQVPLAHHVGVVALREQHLRQEAVLERHVAVVTRKAGGELRDARHRVAVMVATGEDARPARRAQRRRVHVVVPQAVRRERVQARRLDRATETAQLPEARVVEHDEQHVGRALRCALGHRPRRARLVRSATDHPREVMSGLELDHSHLRTLPRARTDLHDHLPRDRSPASARSGEWRASVELARMPRSVAWSPPRDVATSRGTAPRRAEWTKGPSIGRPSRLG